MHITRNVDQEKQLTIFSVDGDVTFETAMEALQSFYEEHPTKNLLLDLRNAMLEFLYYDDLDTLTDYAKQYGKVRAGGKTALVVSRDSDYGLSKMIETFSEVKDLPLQIMRFHSMEKAVQWFEEDK